MSRESPRMFPIIGIDPEGRVVVKVWFALLVALVLLVGLSVYLIDYTIRHP